MIDLMKDNDLYVTDFAQLEKELGDAEPASLRQVREAAMERFTELGFPTIRHEDWRFTNVAPITAVPFRPAVRDGADPQAISDLLYRICDPDVGSHGLVFVNAFPIRSLLTVAWPKGVAVMPLAEALTTQIQRVEPYLARFAGYENHAFIALNTAFLRDGGFIYIPRGVVVETPIHLDYVAAADSEPMVIHPRTLIVAERDSQVTIVESYIGRDGKYFTNAVTEIVLGENAVVDHYKLQEEGREAFHVAALQVQHARGSRFSSHYVGLGGALVRNEVRAVLGAEGCECTVNGLYRATGRQHMDNFTVIDHAMPHCASHELYKGILGDRAHGVFNGKIFVRPDAQKTDAKQTNQTLLLSEDAIINTKPQLEIYADDVKCTHGATVGQLDDTQLFYLRSRGLDEAAARGLLTFAFANDLVSRIRIGSLRARLEKILLAEQGLPADPHPEDAE